MKRYPDCWRHIIDKSDQDLVEYVKSIDMKELEDIYHCIYNVWLNVRQSKYRYEESILNVNKLNGTIQWNDNEYELLCKDDKDYEKCLNKINEYTRKYKV